MRWHFSGEPDDYDGIPDTEYRIPNPGVAPHVLSSVDGMGYRYSFLGVTFLYSHSVFCIRYSVFLLP
jgi:hypothetical protein